MTSKKSTPKYASIRLLTDLSTSEWFWAGADKDGNLTIQDSDSFSNETYAREAAAEYLHVEPEEVELAAALPTPDEQADAEANA